MSRQRTSEVVGIWAEGCRKGRVGDEPMRDKAPRGKRQGEKGGIDGGRAY